MIIFAIKSSTWINQLKDVQIFISRELARKQLKSMANERRHKFGVKCFVETEDEFSYLFGWEEHSVKFSIIELEVITE